MDKAFIDILLEEKELIGEISRLEDKIERSSKWRIFLLMNNTDLELDKSDIKRLQNEIDDLNNQKFDCKRKLEEVRRDITDYFKHMAR